MTNFKPTRLPLALTYCCGLLALGATPTNALPKLDAATRAMGVVAYQDDSDPNQFYAYPEKVPLVLGLTLSDPTVKYWGIGRSFKELNDEYGLYVPTMGGTVSGQASIVLSQDQEVAIREAIKRDFKIDNINLVNLDTKTISIQPVLASNTLGVTSSGDIVFPSVFRYGASFNFAIGSPNNHTFAEYIATRNVDQVGVTPDSSFGVNVVGEAQFRGEPWEFTCKADLRSVWSKVRENYGGSGGYGWFSVSASYQSIQQDLFRSKTIDCGFSEGDLQAKDRASLVFETAKSVLESLNDPENEFFKFQPNPEPTEPGSGPSGPWLISINLAYSSAHFTQEFKYEQTFSYDPVVTREMPTSLTLAVKCDVNTAHFFQELGVSEPCVTRRKADAFDARAEAESKAKARKIQEAFQLWVQGKINKEQYDELKRFYRVVTLSEAEVLINFDVLRHSSEFGELKHESNEAQQVLVGLSDDLMDRVILNMIAGMSLKDAISELKL